MVLALLLLLSGCGNAPPPGAAASEQQIRATVLDWHRLQALVTEKLLAGC